MRYGRILVQSDTAIAGQLTENATSQAVHVQAIWAAISRASSPSCSIVVSLEASKRVSPVGIRASTPEPAPTQQSVSLR
jgi:hypothetical protein